MQLAHLLAASSLVLLLLFIPTQALPTLDFPTNNGDLELTEHSPTSTNSPTSTEEYCRPDTIDVSEAHQSRVPALGVGVELLSCVFSNVGLVIEKMALLKEEKRLGNAAEVQSFKLPMFWLGFGSFVVGQILSGVALSLMSVVVVTPLGSFAVIANLFTSYFLAGEKSGVLQVLLSLLIVTGCILTTTFAPWEKAHDSLDCFREYVGNQSFHTVAAILLCTWVPVLIISRALVLPSQRVTSDQSQWPAHAKIGKWLYPVAAGLISVWTINIGCVLMRLLSQAMGGHASEVMESFEIYVVFVVYLGCITLWQNLMNACMIVLEAAFVIPIHFALFTMLTLPLSGSLHGTLANWHPEPGPLAAYLIGLFLNVAGMFGLLLVGSRMNADSPADLKVTTEDPDTSLLLDKRAASMQSLPTAPKPADAVAAAAAAPSPDVSKDVEI